MQNHPPGDKPDDPGPPKLAARGDGSAAAPRQRPPRADLL
jgi:hypothetical protein